MQNLTVHSAYVAFLDILGFSDLVRSNSDDALMRVYNNLFLSVVALSLSGGAFKTIDAGGQQVAIADSEKIKINSLIVSDSVICWTPNDSMKSFIDITTAVSKIMVSGIFVGLPLRGAISIGPLSIVSHAWGSHTDNLIQTFWARASLTPTACKQFKNGPAVWSATHALSITTNTTCICRTGEGPCYAQIPDSEETLGPIRRAM
jgi:hypothetical protein